MLLIRRLSRFQNSITLIEAEIARQEANGTESFEKMRTIEGCVLRLHNEVELFIRNLILDCATGRFTDSNGAIGNTLGLSFKNRELTYQYLSKKRKTSREPSWAIPKDAIQAATVLGLTNLPKISAELGISPWEIEGLRLVRNFIAHRSKESALKLRACGLAHAGQTINPIAISTADSPYGGKNYVRWAGFMRGLTVRLVS